MTGGGESPSIFLKGGLGNQLFITAKAISLARESGCRVTLRTALMHEPGQTRKFELENLSGVLRSFGVYLEDRKLSHADKFASAISQTAGSLNVVRGELEKRGKFFDYYQQLHIVNSVSAEMIELLDEAVPTSPDLRNESISVHIRRGDYLHPNHKVHGALSAEYFAKAIDTLASIIGERESRCLQVFSDGSLTRADHGTLGKSGVKDIWENGKESGLEMLSRLSSGRGIVMSNSSLSWWSAWLGSRKVDKFQVVCPFPWFKGKGTDLRLYDPTWNLLHGEWM